MIVIVAKKPEPGRVKTRLCPPFTPSQAARLAEAFLQETVRLARASEIGKVAVGYTPDEDRKWFEEQFEETRLLPQGEGDLGARMAWLFDRAFAMGEQWAVMIGSDTPHLPCARLAEAAEALAGGADLAVGPAEDGGYYLIGLRRPAPELFADMEWGTPRVLGETLRRAQNSRMRVTLLQVERDIDGPADVDWLQTQPGPYGEMVRSTIFG